MKYAGHSCCKQMTRMQLELYEALLTHDVTVFSPNVEEQEQKMLCNS